MRVRPEGLQGDGGLGNRGLKDSLVHRVDSGEPVRVGKALDGGRGLLSQLKTLWTRGSYMSKDIVFSFPDASISP